MGWADYKTERNEEIYLLHIRHPEMTLQDIGDKFGITKQRVRCIIAAEKRRKPIRDRWRDIKLWLTTSSGSNI